MSNYVKNYRTLEQAQQRIEELEEQADEYGDLRMVQLHESDIELLRKVLELAWQYVEASK